MIHPTSANNNTKVVRILDVCARVAFCGSDTTCERVLDDQDPRTNRSLNLKRAESLQLIPARSIQSPIAR